jgi:hypothetical protein
MTCPLYRRTASAATGTPVRRYGAQRGDYMFHCHNLVHEDDDMLRAFSVVGAGVGMRLNQSPQFTALNPTNNVIYNNWGYNNPMFGQTAARLTSTWPAITPAYTQQQVSQGTCGAPASGGHSPAAWERLPLPGALSPGSSCSP